MSYLFGMGEVVFAPTYTGHQDGVAVTPPVRTIGMATAVKSVVATMGGRGVTATTPEPPVPSVIASVPPTPTLPPAAARPAWLLPVAIGGGVLLLWFLGRKR